MAAIALLTVVVVLVAVVVIVAIVVPSFVTITLGRVVTTALLVSIYFCPHRRTGRDVF